MTTASNKTDQSTSLTDEGWQRLPGLFRQRELPDTIEHGNNYFFEHERDDGRGNPLFAVYHRVENCEATG